MTARERPFATIRDFTDIPGVIAQMQAAGAEHRVPLLQAVYHGQIAHLEIQRNTSAKKFKQWVAMSRLPAVCLLGDDDYHQPAGPDTWPLAERALRWCRGLVIHGGRGEAEHYQYAITLATIAERVTMIECSSANVAAWQQAADKWAPVPRLTLAPESGRVHPDDSRETMQ